MQNDGYADFGTDDQLRIRNATKPRPDGGSDIYKVENGVVASAPEESIDFEDSSATRPAGYTHDGSTRYWVDSRGRDTAALVAQDLRTNVRTVIAEDARADIGGAMANPVTGKLDAYATNYLKVEWTALDPAIKGDLDFLRSKLKGQVGVTSRTDRDDL